jgi:hypothetical protein
MATAHERGIGPLQKAPAGCSNLSAFMGHLFRAHCLFQSNAGKWKWAIENQQRRYRWMSSLRQRSIFAAYEEEL